MRDEKGTDKLGSVDDDITDLWMHGEGEVMVVLYVYVLRSWVFAVNDELKFLSKER